MMTPATVCLVIGSLVRHSKSPQMHNAGYEALNLPFSFFASEVSPDRLGDALAGARAIGIRGISVTIPFKERVASYLDKIDPLALKIGAINTIVNNNGVLTGYNTDAVGVVAPLQKIVRLNGLPIAVLGSGGASRAAAHGLAKAGAHVSIIARNRTAGEALAHEIENGKYTYLPELKNIDSFKVVINATPVGMLQEGAKSPLEGLGVCSDHVIFDMVYKPRETELLRTAKACGAVVVEGIEMLLYQGMAQFELYTGVPAPELVMKEALGGVRD
jgi:shikimate dehydrogenase